VFKWKFESAYFSDVSTPSDWLANTKLLLLYMIPVVVCCLVFYGTNSIRGTDQYWYLADVEAIIDGDPPVTNAYFPGTLLRGDVGDSRPNYFYHNGPMIYLSAFVGKYTGAYRAWIVINLICHFAVALAIFVGARQLTSKTIARTISAFYLISPLALWQTMSMLLEQYLAGVMALVVIGYFYRRIWFGQLLFVIGILLGTLSHPMFVVIGLMSGFFLVIKGLVRRQPSILFVGTTLLLGAAVLVQSVSNIFPTGFFPTLGIAIANVLPGEESMLWYFSEQGNAMSVALMFAKVKEAIVRQVLNPAHLPFNIFTNIALVAWMWLFAFRRKQYFGVLVASGIVLALYLGLIVLMQHQVRYQQLVSPVAFILIAVGMYHLSSFRSNALVACIFVFTLLLGGVLSHRSHQQATAHQLAQFESRDILDIVSAESKIVAFDCRCDQRLNYLLKPRPILNVKSRYLEESAQARAISLFQPDYFVSSNNNLGANFTNLTPVKTLNDPLYGDLYWYRVNSPNVDIVSSYPDVDNFIF